MKTTTKKILTLILAIVCIATLTVGFVACDTQSSTNTAATEQTTDGNLPPAPPSDGQGGFPGGQGGFPGGQGQGGFPGGQGGFPGGQGGSNSTAATVTTEGADTSAIEAQIAAYDFDLEFDDVTDYTELEVTRVNLDELTEDYVITASGNYVFEGTTEYRVVLGAKNIEVHIWLEDATLDSIFADKKPTSTVITLVGENTLTGVLSDANDDAKGTLYVKNDLLINGNGSLNIASGEDKNGIHCTGKLVIEDATISVNAGKHGVRGNDAVILKGASLDITATTDGIQTDNETDDVTVGYIYIEDSDIIVNSGDDGISAATMLYIKSGEVYVDGPTNSGNSALDTEAGIVIDGGTVVAVGAAGMVETPSTGSAQNVIVYQGSNIQAGTQIVLKDANGNPVLEHTTAKTAQCVIASSANLATGETYTVYVNGTSVGSATLSSTVTYLGTQQGMGGQPSGQGGPRR